MRSSVSGAKVAIRANTRIAPIAAGQREKREKMANIAATQTQTSDNWETPPWLIQEIEAEFGPITLDPCASADNRKSECYFDKETDGLKQPWKGPLTFCNPPYSQVAAWAQKAYFEALVANTTVAFLCAARTDTRWWWRYIRHGEVRLMQGRIRFYYNGQPTKVSAPFPSALVIFRKDFSLKYSPSTVYWDLSEIVRK